MKILLIEDDDGIIDFLMVAFRAESFTLDVARTGPDGSFFARTNPYDIIIMDYSLPLKNGALVCQEIRSAGIMIPIIFLTVHPEMKKKINAFDMGADDYLTKPFSFDELKARIYAIIRRPLKIESPLLRAGCLKIDTRKQTVHHNETELELTKKEYNLLEYLVRNKGMILSRGMIMEHVWNANSDPLSNTVEAHILNLRRKVNIDRDLKNKTEIIRNVPGRGYIIDV
jgi:DNA-binding response OmpR family regulator